MGVDRTLKKKINMTQSKIAVAIPTYRRPELLLELTRSLPHHVPINVSDNDGSLAGLTTQFDSNVSVHHADRLLPIFANWNRAVSFIPEDATHVLIPSDDDLYLPGAVQAVTDAIDEYPSADMIVFGCDFVDEHGKTWAGWRPAREELCAAGDGFLPFESGVNARMPGVLFRTDFLRRIGGFDECFKLTASDSEMIQRAALLGTTAFVPKVIGMYRVWTGSLTHTRQASDLWMSEIDLWTEKIAELLRNGHQPPRRSINVDRFKDNIYTANLRAGIGALKTRGQYLGAWRHLLANRYPYKASLLSQAKLVAHLLLPRRK